MNFDAIFRKTDNGTTLRIFDFVSLNFLEGFLILALLSNIFFGNLFTEKLPMANWPLNDMFMIADITGNGFNLTKVGSAPHSPEGVHFQSGTEYLLFLDMRDPPVLVLDRDFSIMFWIRPESDGGLLQWGNALNEISSIG